MAFANKLLRTWNNKIYKCLLYPEMWFPTGGIHMAGRLIPIEVDSRLIPTKVDS